jgi:hypothetical protein
MNKGSLKIIMVEAVLKRDVEGFGGGQMDPYVKVKWD